ncbi:hypothetical protein chiPu_0028990, partial [Chiloscyllium punctatum]|nr:hypothetical protein [Chiloscyllium punctatum]
TDERCRSNVKTPVYEKHRRIRESLPPIKKGFLPIGKMNRGCYKRLDEVVNIIPHSWPEIVIAWHDFADVHTGYRLLINVIASMNFQLNRVFESFPTIASAGEIKFASLDDLLKPS